MSLHSCRLHGRVFGVPQPCWLPFPEDNIQAINTYAARLRATTTAAFLTVIETSGDACAATFRQLAQIRGATDDLPPGEG
jgi:hypothetical protein